MTVRPFALTAVLLALPGSLARAQDAASAVPSRSALSEPSLSPDGREIAFVAGGDIWTVPSQGGVARLLVAHPATESRPLYSPNGRQLAFTSTRTGNGDVYVMDLESGALSRRTFDDGRDGLDAWSRDGGALYFSSTGSDIGGMNDVFRVSARGGQPAPVAADRYASEYWAAPSPDGSTLAITARGTVAGQWWRRGHSHIDESEIWVVRRGAGGAPAYQRVSDAGNGKDAWPMWSADGRTLYYMSDRSGTENLWAKPLDGAERQLTTFREGRVLWPHAGADGQAIVFERDFAIWRYDVARNAAAVVPITLRGAVAEPNAERQTLSQGFGALAVAPDARKAAFVARGELFVVGTRDGGEATRFTQSTELDDSPEWLPDSRRVVYAANRGGAWNVRLLDVSTRVERALTNGGANVAPRVSPDGRSIAYQRNGRELRVIGVDGQGDRRVADAVFFVPPFVAPADVAWSPDSRWLAYISIDGRGFSNVWVVPAAGGTARQVSFGADANADDIRWAPDGSYLLYVTSMRTEVARVVRIDLVPRSPRFREDQFRDLFGPQPPVAPPTAPPAPPQAPVTRDSGGIPPSADSAPARAGARRPAVITFEGIRLRSSILPTLGVNVGALAISPDGRTLAFTGVAAGQQQLYTLPLDELARDPALRALTTTPGGKAAPQWSADSREIWFLEGGRIAAITVESRQARTVAATAEVDVDFAAEKRAIFRQATSYLAEHFYDDRMNGVDWRGLADRIAPYVEGSRTPDDLRRVLSLMIGELNASHLGINGPTTGAVVVPVGRLGVRFDVPALEQGVHRVAEVVALGPAALAGVAVGDRIGSIDGVPLRAGLSIDSLLMGKVGRRVVVRVANGGDADREVVLRPVSGAAERALLYRQWVEERRAYVAKASGGRLGYVHMADMSQAALDQLHLDLDAENQGRDGVVVDMRNNNGGFVNVYAIDVLSRRSYLNFTTRGAPTSPARSGLGQRMLDRPTVLVVNQHTLSDGEDFTEGYRALGLGKVVGEPTAGWIVFTWNVPLLDGSTVLRIPRARVTDSGGKDMEMAPRPVDIPVVRPVGEAYLGRDAQLDAAVQSLLSSLPRRP